MAPEQQHGGVSDVTPAADVYSAGKLLHYMLTGRYLDREHIEHAFQAEEFRREPRLQIVTDEILRRCIVENPAERLQTGAELLEVCQRVLASFRSPNGSPNGSGGTPLRSLYESLAQSFAGDPRQASLVFDELQERFRTSWDELQQRIGADHQEEASAAAEHLVRSQSEALAAALALARMDAASLFPNFKRFLEFITEQSEGIPGYIAISTIPQVEAGFLYTASTLFALHHESWSVLEQLLGSKFKWVYQSARTRYSYGFSHPYFFHSYALARESTRHHDLFRSVLTDPAVSEATLLVKERLLDVYAQADLLMSLRAVQTDEQGEMASRWADFGRFYPERVTPLLERMYYEPDYASGVLRSFGETREEFFAKLNPRLQHIQRQYFSGTKFLYASLDEWHPR
jgi:hypothetical protein